MSNRKLRIGTDGDIYQVGDTDVSVSQISIYTNGNYIIQNTALNTWNETLESVKIMLSFINEDYSKEMVLVNISLVMLVTGLEAYTKKRFIETYFEGNDVNIDLLINSCKTKGNQESCNLKSIENEAFEENISCLEALINRKYINFQNYDDIKKAYKKGYEIDNNQLEFSQESIVKLKRYIKYRHKIVHVAPMTLMLNQENVPEEQPVFPKKEIALDAIQIFSEYISKLHSATLRIGRNS